MRRTLPAVLILTLAACSSSSSGSSSGTPGGSVTGHGVGTTAGVTGGSSGGSVAGTGSGSSATATTGGGGNGGAVTVDNFNALLNDAFCKFELSCEAAYAPYVLGICSSLSLVNDSDLPLAVDAGRVSFNAAAATACLNALASSVCSELALIPCDETLAGGGLVPPAGACYSAEDCLSDGCTGNNPTDCTPGTCLGLVALGGTCGCSNCGNCDPDAGLVCSSSVCAVPSSVGQPCGTATSPSCALGLDCVDNICVSLPVSAGGPCNTNEGECVSGHYCFETGGASFGNCAIQVAAGQPCDEDANHASSAFSRADNECAGPNPVCLGAGTLVDSGVQPGICATLSDVGGPCSPPIAAIDTGDSYSNGCYGGLNCVGGACVKPPSSGPCATGSGTSFPCDITVSFCASATSMCTPYIALGGTCNPSDGSPCGLAATCNNVNDICQGTTPACSPTL